MARSGVEARIVQFCRNRMALPSGSATKVRTFKIRHFKKSRAAEDGNAIGGEVREPSGRIAIEEDFFGARPGSVVMHMPAKPERRFGRRHGTGVAHDRLCGHDRQMRQSVRSSVELSRPEGRR